MERGRDDDVVDDDDDGDGTTRATPFKILELRAGLVGGESRTPERGGAPTPYNDNAI